MALTTEKAALITEAWMDAFPETTKTQNIILYQTEICDLMMDHIMAINAVVDTSGTPTKCHVNQPIEFSIIQWSNGFVNPFFLKAKINYGLKYQINYDLKYQSIKWNRKHTITVNNVLTYFFQDQSQKFGLDRSVFPILNFKFWFFNVSGF